MAGSGNCDSLGARDGANTRNGVCVGATTGCGTGSRSECEAGVQDGATTEGKARFVAVFSIVLVSVARA